MSKDKSVTAAAVDYLAAGLSILPLRADKTPWGKWERYQTERAGAEEAAAWLAPGVGIVGGAISGGLWVLDFDHGAATIFPQWIRRIEERADGLAAAIAAAPMVATGGGGYHVYIRLPEPRGNETLAAAYAITPEGTRKLEKRIETRGTGGYVVAPPSPHPSGRFYEWIRPLEGDIPRLTTGELEELLAVSRSFDERNAAASPPPEAPRMAQAGRTAAAGDIPSLGEIRAMLGYIGPWSISYEEWVAVLMAVNSCYPGPDGLAAAEEWADGKEGEVARKWSSFKRGGPDGIGIGTLIKMAKERGYTPTRTNGRPGGYHELRDEPPPYYDIGPGPDIPPDEPLPPPRPPLPQGVREIALVDTEKGAARLNEAGLSLWAIAYPGGLTPAIVSALAAFGLERVIVATSSPEATEAAIRSLLRAPSIEGLLVAPMAPDEPLDGIAAAQGIAAAEERIAAAAIRAGEWLGEHLTRGPFPLPDLEEERLLGRLAELYTWLQDRDPLQAEGLLAVVSERLDIRYNEIRPRLERAHERKTQEATRATLAVTLDAATRANTEGDTERTRELLDIAAKSFRGAFTEYPRPYTLERLEADILTEPPALLLPWDELKGVKLPRAGLSVIAADTAGGKTTMMLNLARHYLYDPRLAGAPVYVYTYEEPAAHLAIKLLIMMSGVTLSPEVNFYAFKDYLRDRANGLPPLPNLGSPLAAKEAGGKIEAAIEQFQEATAAGRLFILDTMPPLDELIGSLALISRAANPAAVFVDYVQRIPPPLGVKAAATRQLEIAQTVQSLRRAAVEHGLAIITGSQVNPQGELREARDIAHEAQVVLRLTPQVGEGVATPGGPSVLSVKVEKQRAGAAGKVAGLLWHKETLRIESNPDAAAAGGATITQK